jgi:Phosphotransferase enzyme family
MNVATLLQLINEQHGTAFELLERYASGEQGAFAIADQDGRRYVLKWEADEGFPDRLKEVSLVTETLRKVGYPAPRYSFLGNVHGYSYTIQEALPGTPMKVVTLPLLPRLLELNGLQTGLATSTHSDWPGPVIDPVLEGGDGYCLLDSLHTYSSETAELLDTLQGMVLAHRNEQFGTNDVVHFDFNPFNILIDNGKVSGVIDWEGTCPGDSSFDLATLLFYAFDELDVREHLLDTLRQRVSPGILRVYLAHLILRQVDWSIRHHTRAIVASYLRVAQDVLRTVDL